MFIAALHMLPKSLRLVHISDRNNVAGAGDHWANEAQSGARGVMRAERCARSGARGAVRAD
jgi:hypothetical protein